MPTTKTTASGDLSHLVRALEGILPRSKKTSWGLDVSWDEDEELGTVMWAKDMWAQHLFQGWVKNHVPVQEVLVKLGVHTTEEQPGSRSGSVNQELRLDPASQWFSNYPLVLQINGPVRFHKHFIQISSLGMFSTNLEVVTQRKYLHLHMFYVSNFNTLCFQNLDEHVQATEESICHHCEDSRISHKCVIVWEGWAMINPVWICACTR